MFSWQASEAIFSLTTLGVVLARCSAVPVARLELISHGLALHCVHATGYTRTSWTPRSLREWSDVREALDWYYSASYLSRSERAVPTPKHHFVRHHEQDIIRKWKSFENLDEMTDGEAMHQVSRDLLRFQNWRNPERSIQERLIERHAVASSNFSNSYQRFVSSVTHASLGPLQAPIQLVGEQRRASLSLSEHASIKKLFAIHDTAINMDDISTARCFNTAIIASVRCKLHAAQSFGPGGRSRFSVVLLQPPPSTQLHRAWVRLHKLVSLTFHEHLPDSLHDLGLAGTTFTIAIAHKLVPARPDGNLLCPFAYMPLLKRSDKLTCFHISRIAAVLPVFPHPLYPQQLYILWWLTHGKYRYSDEHRQYVLRRLHFFETL